MADLPEEAPDGAAVHKKFATDLFNRTWELLDLEARTPDQDAEMIHTAHASAYHWLSIGTPVHFARSAWQCSRVYAVLGHDEEARFFAARSLAICEENSIGDFDLAFAYEALARAAAAAGDGSERDRWADLANGAANDITDDDDRSYLESELATIPRSP